LNSGNGKAVKIFARPQALEPTHFQWCPGCTYGIAQTVIAEVIDDMALRERSVMVAGIGCHSAFIEHLGCNTHLALHGRACAVATGMKRVRPDLVVFTIQGDGDLAAIGTGEFIHSAARGERFTVLFMNNGVYGETGGQQSPTTLVGMPTTTSVDGRDPERSGAPIDILKIAAGLDGVGFAARVSMHSPGVALAAKRVIRAAFENQLDGVGFSIVEILNTCPTHWNVTPAEAMAFVGEKVVEQFPLGTFVDRRTGGGDRADTGSDG
jgi:2-oxoglutarate ferredoxin oxidoreductase subunit beta